MFKWYSLFKLVVLRMVNVSVQKFSRTSEGSVGKEKEFSVNVGSQSRETKKTPPEHRLIDRSLEHEESMTSVVGVERLTICAKVLRAECTTVPLPNDAPRMRIAEDKAMLEFTEICYFERW